LLASSGQHCTLSLLTSGEKIKQRHVDMFIALYNHVKVLVLCHQWGLAHSCDSE
jgi:hypothetical protein